MMGVYIDLNIYDWSKLVLALEKWGATDLELTEKILNECGHHISTKYVIVHNELYESGNPFWRACELFDSAFNLNDSHSKVFLSDILERGTSYVDVDEIAEKLEIKLKEDEY